MVYPAFVMNESLDYFLEQRKDDLKLLNTLSQTSRLHQFVWPLKTFLQAFFNPSFLHIFYFDICVYGRTTTN